MLSKEERSRDRGLTSNDFGRRVRLWALDPLCPEPGRRADTDAARAAQSATGCRVAALHCVGLTPKRRRNHREKALGAVKPSRSETSVRE